MKKHLKGFTLIEMLVVIAIIGIVAASSLSLLTVFKGDFSLRKAGQIVRVTFSRGQQYASSRGIVSFVVFNNPNPGQMQIYMDTYPTNPNRSYDRDLDRAIDEPPVNLPRGIEFRTFPQWVGFYPAQGLVFPTGVVDRNPAADFNNPTLYDITCGFSGGGNELLGIDYSSATGRIIRVKYLSQ